MNTLFKYLVVEDIEKEVEAIRIEEVEVNHIEEEVNQDHKKKESQKAWKGLELIVDLIKNLLVKIRKSNFKIIDWFYI